mgnify:FL=1
MDDLLLKLDAYCLTRSCDGCPLDQTGFCTASYDTAEDISAEVRSKIEKMLSAKL